MYGYGYEEAEANCFDSTTTSFRENLMEEDQLYQVIDNGPMAMEMVLFDIHNNHQPIWGPDNLDQQPSTADLFHLPATLEEPTNLQMAADVYDHSYYLNLPHGYSSFGGGDANCDDGGGGGGKRMRRTKMRTTEATERERRIQLNVKYNALTNLIPNPTKTDKASIVEYAIGYTKELLVRVAELRTLVEKKKSEGAGAGEGNMRAHGGFNRSSSSCLQMKSRGTEVDVRVVDDQVTIKLIHRNKINGLLYASQALEELHLDPLHVAGGHFADFSSFWFHIKVEEGSCVSASAIANKLIEAGDRQIATGS